MKICLITNLFKPYNRGGAEEVVINTVKGLSKRDQSVFVITACPFTGPGSFIPKIYMEEGIKIYRYYPLNLFFYRYDYKHNILLRFFWSIIDTFNIHSYLVIKYIIKREKPQVVHTHNLKGISFLIPRLIKRMKIRHLHTLHDLQLICPSGRMVRRGGKHCATPHIFCRMYKFICRRLFGSPDVVIYPSKFLSEAYHRAKFFRYSRVEVLPNPIPDFPHLPHSIFTSKDGVESKQFTVTYIGQLEKHKGIIELVMAFKKVLQIAAPQLPRGFNPDLGEIRLHIVGIGTQIRKVKTLVQNNQHVIFHDYVEHQELPRIFQVTDVLVVPSIIPENSPNVIYEALSFGVPVIASRIGGIPEIVENGYNGLTFEAGNVNELADTIRYAYENQAVIGKMKINARHSAEKYQLSKYTTKLLELYS